MTFFVGCIPFEDVRISRDSWSSMKGQVAHGQLPNLEVDGYVLTQSTAICRYAGVLAGLYPTNDPLQVRTISFSSSSLFALN